MKRTNAEFIALASAAKHRIRFEGLTPVCLCGQPCGSAKGYVRHAIRAVRKAEAEARAAKLVVRAKKRNARLRSIPRAGARIGLLADRWGVGWGTARAWILRQERAGRIVVARGLRPMAVARIK